MATKQIFFFAELQDIKQILEPIETTENIQYCEAGVFDLFDVPIYTSYTQLPNLGFVDYGDWMLNEFYTVFPRSEMINKREIHLKKGGIRYAIYQDNNPNSIILKPGGTFKEGILVAGSIGTISEETFSVDLFNKYAKLIKKKFSKIGSFYVGANAKIKLETGWRLVTNEASHSGAIMQSTGL
jgi:hypothetical protein